MANERKTENIVRDTLNALGYKQENILVEEQISDIQEVKKLLKGASKSGGTGRGAPEFIISSNKAPDFLLVIECKADIKNHMSPKLNKPKDFAVDGVLHYAKVLSKSYNVIAVGVSGDNSTQVKIDTYIWPKGSKTFKPLTNREGTQIKSLLPWEDYIQHGSYDPEVEQKRREDLMAFSRELHNFMRDHAKLTESEKPLLVSGTLIALNNRAFTTSFSEYTPQKLQKKWLEVIKEEIEEADIPNSKKKDMTQPYSTIAVHPELGKSTVAFPRGVLHELITRINDQVWPFISIYHDHDVVGQFYGEFLKYTGGDKKALGIVLTPRHVAELFTLLANLKKDDKVLDFCCGTGGFLISSMHAMMRHAVTQDERDSIKENGLVGVEQQPNMYALAASNMILRGDGKANLYQGSCFDPSVVKKVKAHKCNVGMINPPYSQKDEDLHELVFVRDMLNCLDKGGVGIAIVPMSCGISPHPVREQILENHTLDAVMSMPDDLFYPVGVVTCIMVFTAHIPHKVSQRKTWFGYWKNDGFIKSKNLGRVDLNNLWPEIRDLWVNAYRNRDDVPGMSIKRHVDHNDEWCAEAYMQTDYSKITLNDFEETVRNYLTFKLNGNGSRLEGETDND
ncbi:class I SAM-dependent DNA methyltransferase [Brevibacillus sp. AF8]|uniref:HsdM family class I SAM-dependent methyltransferase n=1 Tax=Brevibacillus sp. AF8 TaxID=2825881 RepID=UPI001E3FFDD3|nr:N-6 DNA methylase [Brevibacillus sp. AF8]MCE0450701.1 N-6 DNA methylase [Brevibacillus sp. AF8]